LTLDELPQRHFLSNWRVLDEELVHRQHFPSVNWNLSYSRYIQVLEPYYDPTKPGFVELRTQTEEFLQKEENFAEILQLVGKNTIGENDKIALEVARVYKNNFL